MFSVIYSVVKKAWKTWIIGHCYRQWRCHHRSVAGRDIWLYFYGKSHRIRYMVTTLTFIPMQEEKVFAWNAPARVRKARESSLSVKGARIFNLLPDFIRNIDSDNVDQFKSQLDMFLSSVPEEPTTSGLTRGAESNSLLHQIPLMRLMWGELFVFYWLTAKLESQQHDMLINFNKDKDKDIIKVPK